MKEQKWIIGIVVALVAMGGIFLSLSKGTDTKVPVNEVAPTAFGQYLKDQGVKFYGASWCPHCQTQKETLGEGTWESIYVECAVKGSNKIAQACEDAKIEAFPTWIFQNDVYKTGALSIEEIKELSGYKDLDSTSTPEKVELEENSPTL